MQAPQEEPVEGVDVGYFTQLGATAGDRTLRRPARLQWGPANQDDARSGTAAGGRTGDQRLPRLRRRPDRVAGGDRKLDRRGARDGGRAQLRRNPLQPRDRGGAPAGLLVQGVRPGRRPRGRHLPGIRVGLQGEGIHRSPHRREGKVRGAQRRRRLLRLQHADRGHRVLGQFDLCRSGPAGGHPPDRPPRPPNGHHDPALDQPGDDDRGSDGRA